MLGDRQCALVRELTKKFEQVVRCTLSGLADMYADTPPKGECVLLVAGAEEQGENAAARAENMAPVSYTHLTLPSNSSAASDVYKRQEYGARAY